MAPPAEIRRQSAGDTNNGFGLLVNWNLLGDGQHTVSARADGVEFARATFTVKTLGTEYLTGQSATCNTSIAGQNVTLSWQQNQQNFVIIGTSPSGGGGGGGAGSEICTTKTATRFFDPAGIYSAVFTITNPCTGNTLNIRVQTPATNPKPITLDEAFLFIHQAGRRFIWHDFDWIDVATGLHVIGAMPPGEIKETTLTVHPGVPLNFGTGSGSYTPFVVDYGIRIVFP